MSRRKGGRAGERGQALPFLAISMLALLGIAGLALDGGLEMTHYRVAQNGVDAGALAAARQMYEDHGTSTASELCGDGTTTGVGPLEVRRNTVVPDTCRTRTLTSYVASNPGYQSYGALTTADENLDVNVGLTQGTLATHVGLNEVTAATTGSPDETASGSVDLASLNATLTLLGLPSSATSTLFGCGTSQTEPGTSSMNGTCPQGSLAMTLGGTVDVTSTIGLTNPVPGVLKQSSTSTVPATTATSQQPQERDRTSVAGDHLTLTNVADITTSVATTTLREGTLGGAGNPGGVNETTSAVKLTGSIGTESLSASNVSVGARITWDPRNGFQAVTSCSATNVALGGTEVLPGISINNTATVYSGCNLSGISIGGLLSVKSDTATNCQQGAGGMVCTADVCFLDITLLSVPGLNSARVCIGKAHASATFQPVTNTAAVTVTGHVPTTTYFIRVLGWRQTNPAATSSAMPQQVLDESSDWFALAPYAVYYTATETTTADQASYCNGASGPLLPGCGYHLYGSNAGDDLTADAVCDPNDLTPSHCWTGRLSSGSAHAVGQAVTPVSGDGAGPSANLGTQYVLLPVIGGNGSDLTVSYFGLFKLDPTHPGCGTLVRTPDPANSITSPAVQTSSDIGWDPDVEGAVSIKVVDTSTLDRLGYA